MRGLLRPWISCSLGKTVPAGPGPRARPGETANAWRAIPIYNTSGGDKEIGRLHWPQWATETGGVQAGQDLAWGGLNRGTGAGACCSASPVPVPRVVPQLHCPTPSHAHLSAPARQARQKKRKLEPRVPATALSGQLTRRDSQLRHWPGVSTRSPPPPS